MEIKITPAQTEKMSKHSASCKYVGAGSWLLRRDLSGMNLKTREVLPFRVSLHCAGCGHSIPLN